MTEKERMMHDRSVLIRKVGELNEKIEKLEKKGNNPITAMRVNRLRERVNQHQLDANEINEHLHTLYPDEEEQRTHGK